MRATAAESSMQPSPAEAFFDSRSIGEGCGEPVYQAVDSQVEEGAVGSPRSPDLPVPSPQVSQSPSLQQAVWPSEYSLREFRAGQYVAEFEQGGAVL